MLPELPGSTRLLHRRRMRYRRLPTTRPTPRGPQEPICIRKKCEIWPRWRPVPRADGATLEDFREAVTTLEDIGRTARRVLGGANPLTVDIGTNCETREPPSAPAAIRSSARRSRRTRPRFQQTIARVPSNSWRVTRGKLPRRRRAAFQARRRRRGPPKFGYRFARNAERGHEEDLRTAQAALRARDTE